MSLVLNDETPLFKMSHGTYAKRKIEEEEDYQNNEHAKKSFASWLSKQMQHHKIDDVLEIFNVLVSILVYGAFIFGTYHDPACPDVIQICGDSNTTP
jgi:hypothetical protein